MFWLIEVLSILAGVAGAFLVTWSVGRIRGESIRSRDFNRYLESRPGAAMWLAACLVCFLVMSAGFHVADTWPEPGLGFRDPIVYLFSGVVMWLLSLFDSFLERHKKAE